MAKGLGKGLGAFFGNENMVEETIEEGTVTEVKINEIRPNPYQPRKLFSEEALEELKESIIQHGIIQPLVVRKSIKGYEIVVGERRYRAAKEANLETVPAIIKEFDEDHMMELALLANLQREDLTPIEEASAYEMLIEKLNFTQEKLAQRLGKSRPHIANHLRLLSLPKQVQQHITDGKLTMGHGRALLGLKNKDQLSEIVDKIIQEQMNVRQVEKWVQQLNEDVPRETKKESVKKDVFILEQESFLRDRFGTTVKIKQDKTKDKGKIEIEFLSKEDLNRILEMLEEAK